MKRCDSCGEDDSLVKICEGVSIADGSPNQVHVPAPGCHVAKLVIEINRLKEQVASLTSQLAAKTEIVPGFERGNDFAPEVEG